MARKIKPKPLCRSEYIRHGGRQAGDRTVECGLTRGHFEDHEEVTTGHRWPQDYDYRHQWDEAGRCPCGRKRADGQDGWRRVRDAMEGTA